MKVFFLGERDDSFEDVELVLEGTFGLSFEWLSSLSSFQNLTSENKPLLFIIVLKNFDDIKKY